MEKKRTLELEEEAENRYRCYVVVVVVLSEIERVRKSRLDSPIAAARNSGSVHRFADRAWAVGDGQGGRPSNSVRICAVGEHGSRRAVGHVSGDDFGGVGHIVVAMAGGDADYRGGEESEDGGELHLGCFVEVEVEVEVSLLWRGVCQEVMWFEGMDDIGISSEQFTR